MFGAIGGLLVAGLVIGGGVALFLGCKSSNTAEKTAITSKQAAIKVAELHRDEAIGVAAKDANARMFEAVTNQKTDLILSGKNKKEGEAKKKEFETLVADVRHTVDVFGFNKAYNADVCLPTPKCNLVEGPKSRRV